MQRMKPTQLELIAPFFKMKKSLSTAFLEYNTLYLEKNIGMMTSFQYKKAQELRIHL